MVLALAMGLPFLTTLRFRMMVLLPPDLLKNAIIQYVH